MLYGSLTMGACYLIASISLKEAESDLSRKQLVRFLTYITPEKQR